MIGIRYNASFWRNIALDDLAKKMRDEIKFEKNSKRRAVTERYQILITEVSVIFISQEEVLEK